ncbi:hypothetical protein LQE92_11535 [Lacrimispora sp. NSJ-141]|uniref:Uncharacterized protein n=1 Tax=Lientehia hominis TaxID=2897778 RepID=A0AAP2RKC4_9FIRM|nr:hypothetical protein [Lientehia hominis]MCD2493251.1 hypothetical protein [Lientehia hominis]
MRKPQKGFFKKGSKLPGGIILSALVVLLCAGLVAARFVRKSSQSGIISAGEFYFFSDLLRETSDDARYTYDSQSGKVSIEIYNFADSKRITPVDIDYEVTVTGGSADRRGGTLAGGGTGSSEKIFITPSDDSNAVIVQVKTTSPYEKTLRAQFDPSAGSSYFLEDKAGNRAAVLTMTCKEDVSGNTVRINLPEGVVPDATDSHVTYVGGKYRYTFADSGVYSLVLLKTDMGITLGDGGDGALGDEITIIKTP